MLRGFSPVDVIEILQSIYTAQQEDIEFLVENLKYYPLDQIYLYYMSQRYNLYGKPLAVEAEIIVLLIEGDYKAVGHKGAENLKNLYEDIFNIEPQNQVMKEMMRKLFPRKYSAILQETDGMKKES